MIVADDAYYSEKGLGVTSLNLESVTSLHLKNVPNGSFPERKMCPLLLGTVGLSFIILPFLGGHTLDRQHDDYLVPMSGGGNSIACVNYKALYGVLVPSKMLLLLGILSSSLRPMRSLNVPSLLSQATHGFLHVLRHID